MADRKKAQVRDDAAKLRSMTAKELAEKLEAQRTELVHARFKHAVAQLDRTSELKAMRRQVARISTILKEKAGEDIHAGS